MLFVCVQFIVVLQAHMMYVHQHNRYFCIVLAVVFCLYTLFVVCFVFSLIDYFYPLSEAVRATFTLRKI